MLIIPAAKSADVQRVVILKVDGLPDHLLQRYVNETGGPGREGHSRLPWIQHVFSQNGVWLENFYSRGLSLSAPSWSLLDTGRHLQIRGNVEYDRYTLRVYDYLNFLSFYFGYPISRHIDMPGVELMDEAGIPLLIDRFPYEQRFQALQTLQRGLRLHSFPGVLKRAVAASSPKDFLDEWQLGLPWVGSLYRQTEADLIRNLKDPQVRYLDYFTGDYDHIAHLTADRVSQLHALEDLDALVGRIWSAIAASPLAAQTALVLVSDHGMNTSETVYSQGFNFVDWFNSSAGGAHHVLTNRHPLTEFKLKGLDPFVSEVITPSPDSAYLAGQAAQYPTVMLDLDGNERANIGLRNNTFNVVQILLDQVIQKRLPGTVRSAALSALFLTLDKVRAEWRRDLDDLTEELTALDARIDAQQKLVDAQPKKWTKSEISLGLDKDARREAVRLTTWRTERRGYSEYATIIRRLLALTPADFDPGKFKMDELIPPKSLGPLNSLWDLQHYVTGRASGGLVLSEDGSLDWDHSFRTIDYLSTLRSISVRNNVQSEMSPQPVDFIAVRIPRETLAASLPTQDQPDRDAVLLWRDAAHQALILVRGGELRYLPVGVGLEPAAWRPGLPLELFEDPQLQIPASERQSWLGQWHDERAWLEAVHRTRYSNGIISLPEELLDPPSRMDDPLDRYRERKRTLRRTDLLLLANDHWNFNVRGFNPGGNHGAFFRESTHSVLLFAGGKDSGIPMGLRVETPYDSLSFVPTILSLMGRPEADLPGPVIRELVKPR
ncbi:MAG: putative superfamily protein [Bryobacterales bacterium]|nr:putative superfamily protein [Bryobacterales bacterium]